MVTCDVEDDGMRYECRLCCVVCCVGVFFFNDTATTEIYTLSLHDALPICGMLAMGVYIFHRSSVQECADMQQRHRISIAHRKPLRYFSAVAVTISLIVLAVFHPVAPVLIL